MSGFSHYSVMLHEAVDGLAVSDGFYVDCTAGGGGHSLEIVKRIENGQLVAVDQDKTAIEAARERLRDHLDKVTFVNENFENIASALDGLSIDKISGALIDLGVSSYQLDTPERGFSYKYDAPLDMRMDESATFTAYDVVNGYDESELKRILYAYGEEQYAPSIAAAIVGHREVSPVKSTLELVDIIRSAMPPKALVGGHHPAKKSFQAIRIEVNRELSVIEPTIRALVDRLAPGGRIAIITFHSLEDRIVKQTFASLAQGCTCPRSFPICVCGNKPKIKLVNKKPILPSEEELEVNPRSRSAKLRIAEKIQ